MASNLTIESPDIDKITKEAGEFTASAINLLWQALNQTRKEERTDFRRAKETLAPKVLTIQPTASVDNLDLEGASILSFNGSTNVNFTGMRAPETGQSRVVFVQVNGTGTITAKYTATSETQNQLVHTSGVDKTLATGAGVVYVYLASKWRQVV